MIPPLPVTATATEPSLAAPSRPRRPRQGPAFPLPPEPTPPGDAAGAPPVRPTRHREEPAPDPTALAAATLPTVRAPVEVQSLPAPRTGSPPEAGDSAPAAGPAAGPEPLPASPGGPAPSRPAERADRPPLPPAGTPADTAAKAPEPPPSFHEGDPAEKPAPPPGPVAPLPAHAAPVARAAAILPLPGPPTPSVALSGEPAGQRNPGGQLPQRMAALAPPAAAPVAFALEALPDTPTPSAPPPVATAPAPRPELPASEAPDVQIGIDREARLDVTINAPNAGAALRLEAGRDELARDLAALGSEVEAIRVELRNDPGPESGADGGRPGSSEAAGAGAESSPRDPGPRRQTEGEPLQSRQPSGREPTMPPPADRGPAGPSRIDRYA